MDVQNSSIQRISLANWVSWDEHIFKLVYSLNVHAYSVFLISVWYCCMAYIVFVNFYGAKQATEIIVMHHMK